MRAYTRITALTPLSFSRRDYTYLQTCGIAFSTQADQPASKHWGFSVKEASTSGKPAPDNDTLDERGSRQSWALGAQWTGPSSALHEEPSTSSSDFTTNSNFKGFKDSCEAGSFTLSPSQILRENGRLEVVGTAHTSPGVRSLVKAVVGGLRAWQQPEASTEGLGGTYFFLDELGRRTAIVKPCDEEPLAPNNPKGFVGRNLGEPGFKPTVRVGEAAMREVAAFLLDYSNFAHVPHTVLVRVTHNVFHVSKGQSVPQREARTSMDSNLASSHGSASSRISSNAMASTIQPHSAPGSPPSKLASLQEFVQHQWDADEMGCSRFPVADVHRIGLLDIRLFNTDRHAGNILIKVTKPPKDSAAATHQWLGNEYSLVPIDHGFCLPEALEPPYFEWLHWPQAKIPFDEEELRYIEGLDADADVEFLRQELPWLPEGSLRTLQVATLLLTKCAAAGLTLAEIGSIASRPLVGMEEEPSQLERICRLARSAVDAEMADADSSSGESEYGSMRGHFIGGGKEASFTHLLEQGEQNTGVVMGRRVPLQSAMSGDELLFDLDEEPGGGSSPKSSNPSSPEQEAKWPNSSRRRDMLAEAPTPLMQERDFKGFTPVTLAAPAQALAQSHTGGLHPRASQHFRKRHYRSALNGHMKSSHGRVRPGRFAYPPHVIGGPASEMNDVFDGLDDSAWEVFVQNLEELIEEALETRAWKLEDPVGNIGPGLAESCPKF